MCASLNRAALYDSSRPVGRIADALEPYLDVLVKEFSPQKVVLFGSYAYGQPDEDSDVDLLIVKPLQHTATQEAVAIRKAWRKVRREGRRLPFDLVLESPETHAQRLKEAAGFYDQINQQGISLL